MAAVVVGYNDSEASRAALRWAAHHVGTTGTVVVVHVVSAVGEWELAAAQIDPDPVRHGLEQRLDREWCAPLRTAGVPYHSMVAVGAVAEQLIAVARRWDVELIVLGMSTRGSLAELVSRTTMRALRGHVVRPVVAVPASWSARPTEGGTADR